MVLTLLISVSLRVQMLSSAECKSNPFVLFKTDTKLDINIAYAVYVEMLVEKRQFAHQLLCRQLVHSVICSLIIPILYIQGD